MSQQTKDKICHQTQLCKVHLSKGYQLAKDKTKSLKMPKKPMDKE